MPQLSGGSLLRKLLVGYDGSAQSERALAFAVEIASHDEGSMIHIACVVQKPAGAPDPVPDELMESLLHFVDMSCPKNQHYS